MFSVSGILVQLEEEGDTLRVDALKKLSNIVDIHWAEISDSLPVIEALSEDNSFSHSDLAAGVASRTFYNLGEYEDAQRLALLSGPYFDVSSSREYEVTMVGKCIDKYIALHSKGSEVDSRLDEVVEQMFQKCYAKGSLKHALGVALEGHRLDKLEETIRRSGPQMGAMLSHCMLIARTLVTNRAFRRDVFATLVRVFESRTTNCNYVELATCLHYLREVKKYAELLATLLKRDADSSLLAIQCAFDLTELQDQRFVTELQAELPSTLDDDGMNGEWKLSDANARLKTLRDVLGEDISAALYLDFLYHNNKTDLLGLNQLKAGVEQRRKNSVLHNATIVAHGYLQAGTTVDAFLRNNLEWLGRASKWSRFSATASLGVIHKGNVKPSMQLLEPYLPASLDAGKSSSPYSEGGALYALGLISACGAGRGYSNNNTNDDEKSVLGYLVSTLDSVSLQESEVSREALQYGACLGIGLVAMSSGDQTLADKLLDIVYADNAVAGESAALSIGMVMLGEGTLKNTGIVESMLSYSKDTGHDKITRGLGLAIAMIMYGQEDNADSIVELLCRDKDPLLRYGGMYAIGMAYVGTANNKSIRQLLHVAVSDVNNDVRRAAVTSLGFVMVNMPQRLPELISLLTESYNPHVRYGACLALAIGCSQMEDPREALQLLEYLGDDKIDFVRQGALLASSILLIQQCPETNPRASALRSKLAEIAADSKRSLTMTRMGAIMASGIMDAGGRNVAIELMSRSGFSKPPAVVGMMLWSQYWYWYPLMHMLSLSFTPTALIGVNAQLDMPVNFSVECEMNLREFDYPKPLKEKKEKKQERVKTAVLSTTAMSKARDALKKAVVSLETMDLDEDVAESKEISKFEKGNVIEKLEDYEVVTKLTNPLRVTCNQSRYIRFKEGTEQRYKPVYLDASHKSGIVVLKDTKPDTPEDVAKVSMPPLGDKGDNETEASPHQPFEWADS